MGSRLGKGYDRASKRTSLSEQDKSTVIERGRGVEFHLQDVKFSDDDIPSRVYGFAPYRSLPFLSPDGMTVFTVPSFRSTVDGTLHNIIIRRSLTDGQARYCRYFTEDQPQGSYFRIAEFDDIDTLNYAHFYALSNDRLGVLAIDISRRRIRQYVIRIGHRPRLAEVTARRSFPIESSYLLYFKFSLQLDNRIVLSDQSSPILILAADIEAPESNKYCHCCRLDGYYSRLVIEAQSRNVFPPPIETLTLGRNGVYADTESFCVLGLEWKCNNELPADLCRRRVEDTVPVFYRFDQQFVNIYDGVWLHLVQAAFVEAKKFSYASYRRPRMVSQLSRVNKRTTVDVFVLDLTRLVHGDAHPEMCCTQYTITGPADKILGDDCLNFVPGTSSVVVQLENPSSLFRLRSAFDVPPLRRLAFEAVYKHMKPEERSKPGWMQTLCGFECV